MAVRGEGRMQCWCLRLHRGDDLLESIRKLAQEEEISSGVILSGVGCLLCGRVRDASGVRIRRIDEECEIVSLMGTVSARRCHIHIALSKEDLSTVGGHLTEGCIVNTTCELVIGRLPGVSFGVEDDPHTGYDEVKFLPEGPIR